MRLLQDRQNLKSLLLFAAGNIAFGLLALTLPASMVAQEVRGFVRDQSTATLLENVLIRVDSVGAVTLTNADGWFTFRGLRKGTYSISFQTMGYDTVWVEVEVPAGKPLEILMPPRPIEIPGFTVGAEPFEQRFSNVQTEMDMRLARLPGDSRVVEVERVRLYDTIQAKDPWRLLWRELRVPWSFNMLERPGYEVYIDDHRTWMVNLIVTPNTLFCRVEKYAGPPYPVHGPGGQLRAYTCLFMAEVAEGTRQMRENLNWGDLIAGPGGGGG